MRTTLLKILFAIVLLWPAAAPAVAAPGALYQISVSEIGSLAHRPARGAEVRVESLVGQAVESMSLSGNGYEVDTGYSLPPAGTPQETVTRFLPVIRR